MKEKVGREKEKRRRSKGIREEEGKSRASIGICVSARLNIDISTGL